MGGPNVAADVDRAGNPIVQAIGAASIPTNRAPGGSQTQFGVQSYGIVRRHQALSTPKSVTG